jgi:single-stranded-DNA-specific exonuclease
MNWFLACKYRVFFLGISPLAECKNLLRLGPILEKDFSQKVWKIAERTQDDLLAQLLVNRGIAPQEKEKFMNPSWEEGTYSPFAFTRMQEAVDVALHALQSGKRIVIHGDYDADGVSGTTLLHGALHEIAAKLGWSPNIVAFLPEREKDGYGVAMHTVDRLGDEGTDLLITVDCGIANGLELGRAHERGMQVIVCDHHQLGQYYPDQAIVLHPLAPNETYPNKTLCGTGVAFKFASALIIEAQKRGATFPQGYEKWFLDLVAIATVTDVMPLTGENRVLEYYGLRVLQKTRRPGLRALIEMSGTEFSEIDTTAIGFRIGPRLNAAGRMASAAAAFEALAAKNPEEAGEKAAVLERMNRERQAVFQQMYKEAEEQVRAQCMDDQLLVAYAPHWAPGIVGLIAGRLQNDFGKPAFALTNVGDHVVGSGRSMGGLHLVDLMNACGDEMYVKRGGHPQACGLTLKGPDMVQAFRERGNAFARSYYGSEGPRDTLAIDAVYAPSEVSWEMYGDLSRCAPFGEGNRSPIFAARNLVLEETIRMGSTNAHLRCKVREEGGRQVTFVGFGFGHLAPHLRMGDRVDIAYEVEVNTWNGKRSLQYRMLDIRRAK